MTSWMYAAFGGAMIGAAAAMLFAIHGRIAGVAGVLGRLLEPDTPDRAWRIAFLGGLAAAGAIAALVAPHAIGASVRGTPGLVVAGLLVGFGTRLGNGCTSGHGVCGLARLSPRSFAAVGTFMLTGALTVWVVS